MCNHSPDEQFMRQAVELARHAEGYVEPNPMVGAVLVRDGEVVGEGWHQRFGGPHAEVEAFRTAGDKSQGATLYVTLEPCCHTGKTPPCTKAIIAAGVTRVVVAVKDPFPKVHGGGIESLRAAGIEVVVDVGSSEANKLLAPYLKRIHTGKPWVIAKWAMTLDGKIASRTGDSQWISSEASRGVVHKLRGRVDAVLVGSRTASQDNPLLTARPPGPRTAARVVVSSCASLSADSQLVQTAREAPVLLAVSKDAPPGRVQQLEAKGVEVITCLGNDQQSRLAWLLEELGQRGMTNVLVEGGGALLGSLQDAQEIDEVHVFIAPKVVGGKTATTPVAGYGLETISAAYRLEDITIELLEGDIYLQGRVQK